MSIVKNCIKEVHEELGIELEPKDLRFIGFEDSPSANHQNVTFRYAVVFKNNVTHDFKFSHKWNEKDEVGDIQWIKIKDINKYKWAFGHEKLIKEIFNQIIS
jgi:8-oxo-dGTP pyrophosphatase MutT (NUDIX family)